MTTRKKDIDEGALAKCVTRSLERYFKDLNGTNVNNVYELVLKEVERPLLEVIMKHAESNQSRAADMLGINRNTLRKKLTQYNLI
ncbi:MAG: DNA-binding transcriptional regulator Fis [Gammaproteobacteria bacterium]|nr:DNA-binding transcriptional regulator Fis [Gammaproteobacteria bacterium]